MFSRAERDRGTTWLVHGIRALWLSAFALISGIAPTLAQSDERPVLPWVIINAPPLAIDRGEYQGRGIHENLVRFYEQLMPEYRHVPIYVSVPRVHMMLSDPDKNFCVPAMFKLPQQEPFRHYARFNLLASPLAILTVRGNASRFGAPGPVSLRKLLDDPDLAFGLTQNRSYASLDPLIKDYRERENVRVHALQNQTTLFQMLLRGRIDYALGLTYEARYIGLTLNEQDTFISIPIVETPNHELTYPNCTRNKWGADIVARLDAINARPEVHLRSIELMRFWSDADAADRLEAAHRKAYHEIYGRDLPPAPLQSH